MNMFKSIGLYDMMDGAIACELGVSIDEFVKKIDETSEMRRKAVIFGCMSDNPKQIATAKRIFNLL